MNTWLPHPLGTRLSCIQVRLSPTCSLIQRLLTVFSLLAHSPIPSLCLLRSPSKWPACTQILISRSVSGGTQIKTCPLPCKALANGWKSHLSWFPDVVCSGPPRALSFLADLFLRCSLVSPPVSLACPLPHHIALVIPQPHSYLLETPS